MSRSSLALITASLIAALVVVTFAPPADARPRPTRGGTSDFQANKEFGLGFMLGDPSGLAGKYYLGTDTALDFGVGYGGYYYRSGRGYYGLHAHMSFLWHPIVLAKPDPFWLPLYFGVGGRYLHHRDFDDRRPRLGVRVPGGIMMDFNNVPIDIFAELAFVVDFITPRDRHRGYAGLHGAVGLRYYFN